MILNSFKITKKWFEEKRKLQTARNVFQVGMLTVCCLMLAYPLLPFLLRNYETFHKPFTPHRGNFSDVTAENGYSTLDSSHLSNIQTTEVTGESYQTPKDHTHPHFPIETSLPPIKTSRSPTQYYQTSTTKGNLSTENGTLTTENNHPVTMPVHVTLENGTKVYIVNTPTCKIPDLDPWHQTIDLLSNISNYEKCHERNSWMYTEGQDLVINKTEINQTNHKWENVRCCFREMQRVTIAKKDSPVEGYYPHDIDSRVKYSDDCFPITADRVKINAEFIRVFCYSKLLNSFDEVLFRLHFAFANPDSKTLKKAEKWKALREQKKAESLIPPNVVVFGIDAVSRLQARRRFTKTLSLLEDLGAVEMVGYTKVGENTHPNTVAFYTGLYVDELKNVCLKNDFYQPQDDCPYIWKGFDKADYVTVFAEDTNSLESGFNYFKVGFREKPTDFYLRPFAIRSFSDSMDNTSGQCIGRFSRPEVALNYVSDVLKSGSVGTNSPVFVHCWVATLSHDSPNDITFLEEPSQKFIQSLDLDNTILILLSDHFVRQGKFRATTLGWYEDRLPLLWIYLPTRVKAKFPEWNESLKINSKRLTSPFDLYQTFVHVLKSFGNGPNYTEPLDIGKNVTRKGNTLFEPISENRTCSQAGIPLAYCPCQEYESLEVGSKIVREALEFSLLYIHKSLPSYCSNFTVKTIEHAKHANFIGEAKNMVDMFVVGFVADPGSFKFEASVEGKWDMHLRKYNFTLNSLEDILRVDKISTNVRCIRDSVLERYCYCL